MLEAPLNKMITVCDEKGYDVTPVQKKGGFIFWIWKDNEFLKEGKKIYKDWQEGQIEVYNKLYKAITG